MVYTRNNYQHFPPFMEIKPTAVIIAVVVIFIMRLMVYHIFDPTIHKTDFYKTKIPKGWKKEIQENEVLFHSPAKNPKTGQSEAVFSIFGYKSRDALFLEDMIEEVMQSYQQANGRIRDKGQVLFGGTVSTWILYENIEPPLFIMSFFMVDDFNRLIRIQYVTSPEKFKEYRPQFEAWKDGIEFKKLF